MVESEDGTNFNMSDYHGDSHVLSFFFRNDQYRLELGVSWIDPPKLHSFNHIYRNSWPMKIRQGMRE